jgi:hypothetical protein
MALYNKLSGGRRFRAFHHYIYQRVTNRQFAIAGGWRLASGG